MTGKVLLDTNIVIALFAGEASVQQRLSIADEVFITSIVLGELYYGAQKSVRTEKNIARIDEFAANNTVLWCDIATARQYGIIKSQLRTKGNPIPENDIWIAAVAKDYQLTLVTRDRHFQHVDGLAIEQW
jgi:tRNA(fMet)-specific endonuclease VapC